MKTVVILLAGALSLSTAFGSDPFAEERFKAKYGRYTPAEEARREALKKAEKAAKLQKSEHAEAGMCDMPDCCKSQSKTGAKAEVSTADTHAEALFRAKYGRPSPVKEVRIAEAKREAAEKLSASSAPMCNNNCCNSGE
jgi:hypothetical protein